MFLQKSAEIPDFQADKGLKSTIVNGLESRHKSLVDTRDWSLDLKSLEPRFRMAIFDGYMVFKLSPLKIDNPSFAHHMKRKLRRETIDSDKRLEIFIRENGVVVGSFAGAMVMGQLLYWVFLKKLCALVIWY